MTMDAINVNDRKSVNDQYLYWLNVSYVYSMIMKDSLITHTMFIFHFL